MQTLKQLKEPKRSFIPIFDFWNQHQPKNINPELSRVEKNDYFMNTDKSLCKFHQSCLVRPSWFILYPWMATPLTFLSFIIVLQNLQSVSWTKTHDVRKDHQWESLKFKMFTDELATSRTEKHCNVKSSSMTLSDFFHKVGWSIMLLRKSKSIFNKF